MAAGRAGCTAGACTGRGAAAGAACVVALIGGSCGLGVGAATGTAAACGRPVSLEPSNVVCNRDRFVAFCWMSLNEGSLMLGGALSPCKPVLNFKRSHAHSWLATQQRERKLHTIQCSGNRRPCAVSLRSKLADAATRQVSDRCCSLRVKRIHDGFRTYYYALSPGANCSATACIALAAGTQLVAPVDTAREELCASKLALRWSHREPKQQNIKS